MESELELPITSIIEKLVDQVPGWSPLDQLFALFNLVYLSDVDGDILELGSWCGRSASVLGLAASMTGTHNVYCVDLFPEKSDWHMNSDGTYSFSVVIDGVQVGAYKDQTVWAEPYMKEIAPLYEKYGSIYNIFRKTITDNSLNDIVTPFKGTLKHFVENAPKNFKCKLAFIDGDHGYNSVCQDIEQIEQFLVPGAWLCFDDAFSCYDGVNKAIIDRVISNPRYERCHQLTRKFFAARFKK